MPREIVGVRQSHASIMEEFELVFRVVGIAAVVVQSMLPLCTSCYMFHVSRQYYTLQVYVLLRRR